MAWPTSRVLAAKVENVCEATEMRSATWDRRDASARVTPWVSLIRPRSAA
jgi:hypothetical protein